MEPGIINYNYCNGFPFAFFGCAASLCTAVTATSQVTLMAEMAYFVKKSIGIVPKLKLVHRYYISPIEIGLL